ncbi:MAG: GTP-binding protein [Candidatus Lokiarchaeota archaeon]|nr:GTP-binding protein [Candidatus Lokiarchaeota archaeon]
MDREFVFKLIILGDKGVGKTTLTYRYVTGLFRENLKQTIGIDIFSKFVEFEDKLFKFQIWDFGGEERFRSILPKYCTGADVALILYDIKNMISYEHLPIWINIVKENTKNIPILLIGTKNDLKKYREVPLDKGMEIIKTYNLNGFHEISSLTGDNIEKIFNEVVNILIKEHTLGE